MRILLATLAIAASFASLSAQIDTVRMEWDTIPMPSDDVIMAIDTCGDNLFVVSNSDIALVRKGFRQHLLAPLRYVTLSDAVERGDTWFVSTTTNGLSYSTNQGLVWRQDTSNQIPKSITSIGGTDSMQVLLSSAGTLVVRNSNTPWKPLPCPFGLVRAAVYTRNTVFALTDTSIAYYLVNSGTWKHLRSTSRERTMIKAYGDSVVAVTSSRVFMWIDNPEDINRDTSSYEIEPRTWTSMAFGACGLFLVDAKNAFSYSFGHKPEAIDRTPWSAQRRIATCDCVGDRFVVATNDPQHRVLSISTLRGEKNWRETTIMGSEDIEMNVVAVKGNDRGGLFVISRNDGLWWSNDTGSFALNVSRPFDKVVADGAARVGNDFLVTSLYGGQFLVKSCGVDVERATTLPFVVGTLVVTVSDTVLVSCLLQDNYLVSTDKAKTWHRIPPPDTFGIIDKMFGIGDRVYVTSPKGVRYADAPNFEWKTLVVPNQCAYIQRITEHKGNLVVGCFTGTFLRSPSGNWSSLTLGDGLGPAILVPLISTETDLIGSGKDGFYRSRDLGTTWTFTPSPTHQRLIVLGVYKNVLWGFLGNGPLCFLELPR